MANCVRCGSELKPSDKFCQKCGTLNIQPVKRARWNWLPWVVALSTAIIVIMLAGTAVLEIYRRNTGYYEWRNDPSQNVTVTDAVNETFSSKLFGENTKFAYPEVSIKGKNTKIANKTIAKEIEKYHEGREGEFAADYFYYFNMHPSFNKKVLSIVVEVCYVRTSKRSDSHFFVYNISIEDGRLLNDEQVLRKFGIGKTGLENAVKKTYDSYVKTVNLTEEEKKELYNDVHLAEPFFGEDGHLCFMTVIPKEDGDNESILFDADTKKVLPGPIVFKGNGNLNDME